MEEYLEGSGNLHVHAICMIRLSMHGCGAFIRVTVHFEGREQIWSACTCMHDYGGYFPKLCAGYNII